MLCSYAVVVVLCSHHQSILVEVFNALNVLQNVLQIRILAGCMLFIACLLHNFLILLRTVRIRQHTYRNVRMRVLSVFLVRPLYSCTVIYFVICNFCF